VINVGSLSPLVFCFFGFSVFRFLHNNIIYVTIIYYLLVDHNQGKIILREFKYLAIKSVDVLF